MVIASTLDSMMMNAAAAWNNTYSPLAIDDPTQGCLSPRALVTVPVVSLFAITTAGTIAMGLYLIALLIRRARDHSSVAYRKAAEDCTPVDCSAGCGARLKRQASRYEELVVMPTLGRNNGVLCPISPKTLLTLRVSNGTMSRAIYRPLSLLSSRSSKFKVSRLWISNNNNKGHPVV
jgi:hypothetical protein